MTTRQLLLRPTESRVRRSNPVALREWRDFLAPRELEAQRVVTEIIASTMHELHTRMAAQTQISRWSQDKLIDFALNASYPDDIEEQIEQSWRR